MQRVSALYVKWTLIFALTLSLTGGIKAAESAANIPVSTSPPGGLAPEDTPQFIIITFDDAVNASNFDNILKILDHQNADGSPIAMTFYVSLDFSDYYLIHKLHAAGNEIAVHTITHTTGNNSSFDTWIREIEGCRESLVRYAGIPREQITGFRTPYLAYNADTFKALSLLGFSYDSSVPETAPGLNTPDEAHYIWPYTLHDGLKQNPSSGTPPSEPLPGLMEIPMWTLIDPLNPNGYHNMDPDVATEAEMLTVLKNNFNTRYQGNRVPVGIYFHKGWLTEDKNINAMNDFLEWALAKPDVFVVSAGALAKWMRNPVSAETAVAEGSLTVQSYPPIPENEVINNALSPYGFRSVLNPANVYPTPDTAFLKRVKVQKPITFRVDVTSDYGGSYYEANLVAVNAGTETVSDWQVDMDAGDNVMSWMWPGDYVQGGGTITITKNGVTEMPPGETIIAQYGGNGEPATLGIPQGTFWQNKAAAPRLMMGHGQDGGKLNWDRVAPVYELQGKIDPLHGDWEVIQTIYGQDQTEIAEDSPYLFYRLHCIH